jgi:periplasmic divalent cation tolerance protein
MADILPGVVQVVTTTSSQAEAERIARLLVERRLAACAQLDGPITSIYRWQGNLETAEEWRLTLKSIRARLPQLEAAIRELHSYETPEILATPVVFVAKAYHEWLLAELADE